MSKRFPSLSDILPVFAIIAALFYGWTMLVFLWKLPGWLFFLSLGEIAILFAFELTTNLVESLAVLALILLVTALLPSRILKDHFPSRGGAVALAVVGTMILLLHLAVTKRIGLASSWPIWTLVIGILSASLAWVASRFGMAGRFLAGLGDRLTVFLFILLPLSVISLAVVLVRLFF